MNEINKKINEMLRYIKDEREDLKIHNATYEILEYEIKNLRKIISISIINQLYCKINEIHLVGRINKKLLSFIIELRRLYHIYDYICLDNLIKCHDF